MGVLRDRFAKFGLANVQVVRQAPLAFVVLVVMALIPVGTGMAFLFNWRYGGVIDQKNATIAFQDEQLNSLRQAASSVTASGSRHLSNAERAELRANFATQSDRLPVLNIICFDDDESAKYAQEFVHVFERSAIPVVLLSGGVTNPDDVGLMIGLTHPDNPSANAKRFIALMKKSGFDLNVVSWLGRAAMAQYVPPQYPDADFDLFVGPQP